MNKSDIQAIKDWFAVKLMQPIPKRGIRPFHRRADWKVLRESVFARDGRVCRRCGATERLQIDHIKPKSKFPELALIMDNLQVLCWPCNKAKHVNVEPGIGESGKSCL